MSHSASFALFCLLAAPSFSSAQPAASGYVVRTDADSIYLDLGEASGAEIGQGFTVYKEGTELKHPKTGASLGFLEEKLGEGVIREVLALYSVGKLSTPAPGVQAGARARLAPAAAPAPVQTAPAAAAPAPAQGSTRAPRWRGPTLPYPATGMAIADLKGDGGLWTVVSDSRNVYVYGYPPKDNKPVAQFHHGANAPKIMSLEAADINGNGKSEIFASLFNETLSRVETVVLELDDQGALTQLAELPWIVRGRQDGTDKTVLAVQQLIEDNPSPYGTIYPLAYQDGKYGPGRPAIRRKHVDWIYDFTEVNLDNTRPAVVSVTGTELIRVQFEDGYWKTSEDYNQTPNRLRWANRLLNFHPKMVARYDEKGVFGGLYVVKNIAALGGLASPFGLFNKGEIHRKDWTGVALATAWVSDIGGFSPAVVLVSPKGAAQELAVAVVGSAGKSAVWAFDP